MADYKKLKNVDIRKCESSKLLKKYNNKIPIIINVSDIPITERKFLVPNDITIQDFIYILRKRIKLTPEQSIFIFINNNLPPMNVLISEIYKNHCDEDGFLYISLHKENTFG
jgi:GABA(A) receptor-associated protein